MLSTNRFESVSASTTFTLTIEDIPTTNSTGDTTLNSTTEDATNSNTTGDTTTNTTTGNATTNMTTGDVPTIRDNTAPFFVSQIKSVKMYVNDAATFIIPPFIDHENDNVTLKIDYQGAAAFILKTQNLLIITPR